MPLRVLLVRPWHVTAALLVTLSLLLIRIEPAQAALGFAVTLNDTAASANTDASMTVTLENDLPGGGTITITFPAGWTVANGAITAINTAGFAAPPASYVGNAAARTVVITTGALQSAAVPAPTLTFVANGQIVNPASTGTVAITVDASNGDAQGSANVTITAGGGGGGGGGAVTGGNVTLTSGTVGANTAGTVAFTLGGALAPASTITLTFPAGWTVTTGALTTANWTGLDAAPVSVTGNGAARTVAIVTGAPQTTLAVTLAIAGSSQVVNRTTPGVGVTISIAATGLTTGTSNAFNVVAGAPSAYTLTGPGIVNAGVASTNFTITITDAFGNTVNTTQNTTFTLASTAAGTVTFNPVSPVTVTTGTSSVTFTYTATQAGAKTITATRASGDAVGGPQTANITVNAGAAAKLQLLVPGESASAGSVTGKTGTPSAQTTGAAFTVTVNMVDANWNVVTSTDTVGITSTGVGATLPANAALVAGTKTFNVTLNAAGTPTVTATDITNGARTASTSPAITVSAAPAPTPTPTPPPDPEPDPGPQGGGRTVVTCGQNQVSDGAGGCVCVAGYSLVGGVCVQGAPKLTNLTLVPVQAGVATVSVPVVDGQTTYEVEVVAYDSATRGPRYNLVATMSDPAAQVKVSALGLQWDPTGISFQSGESFTFIATGSSGTSPTYTVRLRAATAQCPPGSFSATGAAPCTSAPPGKYVSTAGATQAIACPAGSYSATEGAVACTQAPAGTFVATTGAIEATPCPTGQTSAVGATSCRGALAGAAVTLSSATANATNVTATIMFDTSVAIPSGGKIKVTLPGLTWPSTPTATFTAPSALGNSAAFASNVLTVTLPGGAPAGAVTFNVTGATLPAAQAALATVRFEVTSGADTVLASTSSGTLVAITAGPEIRLVFTTPPPANTMGAPFTVEATAQDERGQTMPVTGTVSLLLFDTSLCTPGSTGFCIASQTFSATFVDGVATFSEITLTEQTISRGRYFFRARHAPAGQPVLQAESAEFNVLPKLTLVFTTLPSTTGVVGQPLAQQPVVEVRDSANNRVTTGSYRVSFAGTTGSGQGPFPNGSATATTVEGIARFTNLTFSRVDTYMLAADAEVATGLFISTDPAPEIRVTAAARATKLVFVTPLPKFVAGQKATVQVRATDADGNLVTSYSGQVTLSLTGAAAPSSSSRPPVSFVNGTATVLDVTPASAGALKLDASSGTLTAATTTVTVADDTAVSYISFTQSPGYEVNGVAFSTQPVVTAYTKSGKVATTANGAVTLTGAAGIMLTTAVIQGTFVSGVATFTGVNATRITTGTAVISATLTATFGTFSATSSPFGLYQDAASAAAAQSGEQSKSKQVTVKLGVDPAILGDATQMSKLEAGIKADLCAAVGLPANCSINVSLSRAITLEGAPTAGLVPVQAVVTGGSTELRELNANVIEARLGVAPRGTGIIAAYSALGRDQDGVLLLAPPSGPLTLTLVVGAGDVPPGTPAGDLKVAVWDGEARRWLTIPTRALRTADGGYQLMASAGRYGVYSVLYVPGAGLVSGFSGFGPSGGLGLGVFAGGTVETLAQVAALNEADGVWVQDASGEFRVLVIGGPAFMRRAFDEAFPDGLAPSTPVLLVQNRR